MCVRARRGRGRGIRFPAGACTRLRVLQLVRSGTGVGMHQQCAHFCTLGCNAYVGLGVLLVNHWPTLLTSLPSTPRLRAPCGVPLCPVVLWQER